MSTLPQVQITNQYNKMLTDKKTEINNEADITTMPLDGDMAEIAAEEYKVMLRKKRTRRIIAVSFIAALAIAAGVLIILSRIKYSSFELESSYDGDTSGASFALFESGFIRCSKSGIGYMDTDYNAIWDEGLSMTDARLEFAGSYGLVYDRGKNTAMLFTAEGKKTEITSPQPIIFASLSEYGVTVLGAADGTASKIEFYNPDGALIDIEIKNVLSESSGYPVDIALSPSGTKLMLSLIGHDHDELKSRLLFLDFEADRSVTDRTAGSFDYEGTLFPKLYCMDENTFAACGDDRLVFYDFSGDAPEVTAEYSLTEKVQSVFGGNGFAGMITKAEQDGYRIKLYNKKGEETFERIFDYDYMHAKVSGDKVLVYGGETNLIVSKSGAVKYEGSFGGSITDMLPLAFNRYLQCGDFGMRIIRLV